MDTTQDLPILCLFPLGDVVITHGAHEALALDENPRAADSYLRQHAFGQWGDLCDEDKESNDEALKHGERLLSAYTMPDGGRLWIITEWDRSVTTLLLPCEY